MARPTLMGLHEIGARLGVTSQRALQIVRDHADFPEPVAELGMGRVWAVKDVEAWVRSHPRRRPGRPRRTS